MLNRLAAILLLVLIIACKDSKDVTHDAEPYYFPLHNLKDGKVYAYESVGNENDPPVYWFFKSKERDGRQLLNGTSYGPSFNPDQAIQEEKVDNGILLRHYFTFERNSFGETVPLETIIEVDDVFAFSVKKYSAVVITSIKWTALADSSNYTFIRNRQFETETSFTFDNKNYKAIKLITRELVDQEKQGHLELEYSGVEIYAKNLGLVYFSKEINESWQMRYELKKVYSVSEFEEKFGVRLSESSFSVD